MAMAANAVFVSAVVVAPTALFGEATQLSSYVAEQSKADLILRRNVRVG
jgi:hypothetical protein